MSKIHTFSTQRSLLSSQIRGIRRGLRTCCGTNFALASSSAHHHGPVARPAAGSAIRGVSTQLFASEPCSYQAIRTYASNNNNNIPVAPTPASLLRTLCDTEINDFKTLIPENEDNQTFLDESGFELTNDKEYAFLKKTADDGAQITVRFDLIEQMQEPFDQDYNDQMDQEGEENNEEAEEETPENEEEPEEEGQEGEEGENQENPPHDHPFEIQITRKVDGKDVTVTFGCFASADGSYTVSGFFYGGFNDAVNPVDIGGTSPEFQDNILLFLQKYGVSEGLSFFIHEHIHGKKLKDYVKSFEALKGFIGN